MKNDEIVKTDNLIPQDFPFSIAWKEYKEANKNIAKNKKLQTEADFKRVVKDCLKTISHYRTHSTTPVISIAAATSSVPGTMSAADKAKLDGIASGATAYSHPTGDGNMHLVS